MAILLGLKYSLFYVSIYLLWFIFIIIIDLITEISMGGVTGLISGVILASIITTYKFEKKNKRLLCINEIVIIVLFVALWVTIINLADWIFLTERSINNPLFVIGNISAVQVIGTLFILFSFRGRGKWNEPQ